MSAPGSRLGTAAAVLTVIAFALSVPKMLSAHFHRPDYQSAAGYVAAHARAPDAVVDVTGALSPGPLTGFDVSYHGRPLAVFRARSPQERDHPYTVFDPVVSLPTAVSRAVRAAHGARVFLVTPVLTAPGTTGASMRFPSGYRLTVRRRYPGIQPTLVEVYSRGPAARP